MSRETVSAIMISLLVLGTLALTFNVQSFRASGEPALTSPVETTMSVAPPSITVSPGQSFTINMTVNNVTNLNEWQVALKYNATIVNCTATWIPQNNVFAGQSTIPAPPVLNDPTLDGYNYTLAGNLMLSGSVNVSQGILLTLNFTCQTYGVTSLQIATATNPVETGNVYFPTLWHSFLLDPDETEMAFTAQDGLVTNGLLTLTIISARDSPNPGSGNHYYSNGSSLTCSVTSPVTEGSTVWTCTGWTGAGSVPSTGTGKTVTFTISQDSTITWNWQGAPVQWKLTVSSAHDSPSPGTGDHLYSDGSSVTCTVTSPVTEGSAVWTCTGWSGTGSVPPSGPGTSVPFTIAQNSSITWNWQGAPVQWKLTVSSAHDSPNPGGGDHYYSDGSSVTCSVASPVTEGSTVWTCTGLSGTGSVPSSGSGTSVTFTMTQDSTITWNWQVGALVHDVAVTNATSSKTIVGQGYDVNLTVTVLNQGDVTETFNLTVYANTTSIASQNVTLSSGNSTIVPFTWNTTSLAYGNYTISAYAMPVSGETNTANNNYTGGWAIVSLAGDITGSNGWPDGKVDMRDIGYVARRFLCNPGDPLWDPNADINSDGTINMKDIGIAARHFLEQIP